MILIRIFEMLYDRYKHNPHRSRLTSGKLFEIDRVILCYMYSMEKLITYYISRSSGQI